MEEAAQVAHHLQRAARQPEHHRLLKEFIDARKSRKSRKSRLHSFSGALTRVREVWLLDKNVLRPVTVAELKRLRQENPQSGGQPPGGKTR